MEKSKREKINKPYNNKIKSHNKIKNKWTLIKKKNHKYYKIKRKFLIKDYKNRIY